MTTWIFGPCSAESREQVMETAGAIRAVCGRTPFIFRAGVWKPRTSPRTFQGAGEQGLEWLKEVKRTYGVEVATEVATPEHVAAALKAGIDYLWIGARTSANPLAVQALADAIGAQNTEYRIQTDNVCTLSAQRSVLCQPKAVLIKNPVNADPDLWLGNIERLEKTGIPVMAVHRGCNHQPCWKMAHTVRTKRPDIPMLLDPSHLSGDAERIPALMAKVAELQLDGAMIEVHAHPEAALSDAQQQLRPEQLSNLGILEPLGRQENPELNWLRAEIDELDDALWDTIAARMDVSRRIGEWKKAHGVTPLQPQRFEQILSQRMGWAKQNGLDAELVAHVMEAIHKESLKQQK